MFNKKLISLSVFSSLFFVTFPTFADVAKDHIAEQDLTNPTFICKDLDKQVYTKQEQQLVDTLWHETLIYLKNYADSLTTSTGKNCYQSDSAIYDTTTDVFGRTCVMENEDMKKMVKHIYQIVENPDLAKACFSPRKGEKGLTMPEGALLKNSPVAQWLDRQTISEYYQSADASEAVKKHGKAFADNFSKMVTGADIQLPKTFKEDVSANGLPNLWASVGWSPMYAANSDRNRRNFDEIRGGYAYAEVLGHWGLLRIASINAEPVGAEVGMVTQRVDSFYPYHNHAIAEAYYTIRQPACANEFKSFAMREGSEHIKTISETATTRKIEIDTNYHNEHRAWASSEPNKDPLTYFHANTIHAFKIDTKCEAKPEEKAIVTVWARSNADNLHNDYGNTHLCESASNPNTPALHGEKIRCDLTKQKW